MDTESDSYGFIEGGELLDELSHHQLLRNGYDSCLYLYVTKCGVWAV